MRHRHSHRHVTTVFTLSPMHQIPFLQTNYKSLRLSFCKIVLIDGPSVTAAIYCMDSLVSYMAAHCFYRLQQFGVFAFDVCSLIGIRFAVKRDYPRGLYIGGHYFAQMIAVTYCMFTAVVNLA